LPFILLAWAGVRAAGPLLLPLAGYFAVRVQTSAFWPQQAPDYYRFTTDISALATNAAHYLDRGGTVFALATLVLLVASRTVPRLTPDRRLTVLRGLIWFAGGYALTIWVPVRSSLYALFPSVGTAIVLATMMDAVIAQADARRLRHATVALLSLPFLLWPVYRARNVRWVELADLTRRVMPQLEPYVPALRNCAALWIHDDDRTRANIRNAFGGQMNSALQVQYGVAPTVHVTSEASVPPPDAVALRLRDGRLVRPLEHR
jgi:hypothetical protein